MNDDNNFSFIKVWLLSQPRFYNITVKDEKIRSNSSMLLTLEDNKTGRIFQIEFRLTLQAVRDSFQSKIAHELVSIYDIDTEFYICYQTDDGTYFYKELSDLVADFAEKNGALNRRLYKRLIETLDNKEKIKRNIKVGASTFDFVIYNIDGEEVALYDYNDSIGINNDNYGFSDESISKFKNWFKPSLSYFLYCSDGKDDVHRRDVTAEVQALAYARNDEISNIDEFLIAINEITRGKNVTFFYRGHKEKISNPLPGIYRNDRVEKEDVYFREIERRCPTDFLHCDNTFEKLVHMQHYELPTRLLDITSNPLIALYFACAGTTEENKKNGEVVVYEVPDDAIKYYDSDRVTITANLARLPTTVSLPLKLEKKEFNSDHNVVKLLHLIKDDKPQFVNNIDPIDIDKCYFVRPKLQNPRIIRQSGSFILFGNKASKSNVADFNYLSHKIEIKSDMKHELLTLLNSLNINQSTIFPEIDKVAHYLLGDS